MGFPKFPVLAVERLKLNMGICGNYYVAVLTALSSCINKSLKQTTKYCVIFTRNILIIVNPGQFRKLDEEIFSHAAAELLFGQVFYHIQKRAACRRSLPIILQKVISISDYFIYFGDLTSRPSEQKQKQWKVQYAYRELTMPFSFPHYNRPDRPQGGFKNLDQYDFKRILTSYRKQSTQRNLYLPIVTLVTNNNSEVYQLSYLLTKYVSLCNISHQSRSSCEFAWGNPSSNIKTPITANL